MMKDYNQFSNTQNSSEYKMTFAELTPWQAHLENQFDFQYSNKIKKEQSETLPIQTKEKSYSNLLDKIIKKDQKSVSFKSNQFLSAKNLRPMRECSVRALKTIKPQTQTRASKRPNAEIGEPKRYCLDQFVRFKQRKDMQSEKVTTIGPKRFFGKIKQQFIESQKKQIYYNLIEVNYKKNKETMMNRLKIRKTERDIPQQSIQLFSKRRLHRKIRQKMGEDLSKKQAYQNDEFSDQKIQSIIVPVAKGNKKVRFSPLFHEQASERGPYKNLYRNLDSPIQQKDSITDYEFINSRKQI